MIHNLRMYVFFAFVIAGHLASCAFSDKSSAHISASQPILSGHARAYDGDSLFFNRVEVRLDAIDAPERDQACMNRQGTFWPCGIASRDALQAMIADNTVHCALQGRDKYRRLLGRCYVNGKDLNAAMVEAGYAAAYHHFSERYASEESRAKAAHAGVWQDAHFTQAYYCRHFEPGHTCYEYDYAAATGRVAPFPLTGKSRAANALK